MSKQKQSPVKNAEELLYKLTQTIADVENGEKSPSELDGLVKATNAICNIAKTKHAANELNGIRKGIDFFSNPSDQKREEKKEITNGGHIDRPEAKYSNSTPYGFAKEKF